MSPAILLIIGVVITTVVISLIVKKTTSPKGQWIHGMRCPKCGSDKCRWARYSDRKICNKGHIFS